MREEPEGGIPQQRPITEKAHCACWCILVILSNEGYWRILTFLRLVLLPTPLWFERSGTTTSIWLSYANWKRDHRTRFPHHSQLLRVSIAFCSRCWLHWATQFWLTLLRSDSCFWLSFGPWIRKSSQVFSITARFWATGYPSCLLLKPYKYHMWQNLICSWVIECSLKLARKRKIAWLWCLCKFIMLIQRIFSIVCQIMCNKY